MSPSTIKVSNLAPNTTEQNLKDFFTFCGNITSIDYNDKEHTATVTFEKPSAAKTALMLNGGTLDGSHLTVTSDSVNPDEPDQPEEKGPATHPHIDQTDKPRAGIAAEYLAHGYVLSDHVLRRAIEIDNTQGISKSFMSYFTAIDKSLGSRVGGPDQTVTGKFQEVLTGAHAKAKEVDQQQGISKIAESYYTKALQHPLGMKVRSFYTSTAKQVTDIHEEAKRIAEHKKNPGATPQPESTTPASSST
ncbi:hypothetical protein BU17DRAFT_71425 [Hysterangium stoloniferum]|nr:hypothetical protein BU17DRAFT_71425 [Hysterangium stoloniferum]